MRADLSSASVWVLIELSEFSEFNVGAILSPDLLSVWHTVSSPVRVYGNAGGFLATIQPTAIARYRLVTLFVCRSIATSERTPLQRLFFFRSSGKDRSFLFEIAFLAATATYVAKIHTETFITYNAKRQTHLVLLEQTI